MMTAVPRLLFIFAFAVLIMPVALCAQEATPQLTPSAVQHHTEVVSGSAAEYPVTVGGLLDMDNTLTREHAIMRVAFQNNVSLTIANTGGTTVTNPWIVANNTRGWRTLDDLLAECRRGAENPQDLIYLTWELIRSHRHHDDPIFNADLHDPIRILNIYGGGLCDDMGMIGSVTFRELGFNAERGGQDPFVHHLHGHMQCEVFHDGDFQFMDIDQDVFFLDRENRRPVSGDALVRDHDLAKRELAYGPILPSWQSAQQNASLFGIDDGRTGCGTVGHRMDHELRPGERLVFRWDNIGKFAWERSEGPHRYYGNSKIVYEPAFDHCEAAVLCEDIVGFERDGAGLRCTADAASVTFKTATTYTMCGGTASALFTNGTGDTAFRIECSLDGESYATVWEGTGPQAEARAALEPVLTVHGNLPRRTHFVRYVVEGGKGARVRNIVVDTDIVAAPMGLPRLQVGENAVAYSDETTGPHEVTLTHEWVECDTVTPPTPPSEPVSPKPGETIAQTYVPFEWPAVEGCDAYHIRVSRRDDLAYPYRVNYDVIIPSNEYLVPKRGMFNPGETYYWRVRPRLACGVWGGWSPVWTFQWQGPMVPRNVVCVPEGDSLVLTWEPNPNGTRPARYDVYASDERGFSVHKGPQEFVKLGEVPSNFGTSTTDTSLTVVSSDATESWLNKAYYRVVAVDGDGIESCPSDFAELPRPYVFTRPVTEARAGRLYKYRMDTIRTIGDLQSRYIPPGHSYWEREAYAFTLEEGPEWLSLDADTGLLRGKPGDKDTGVHPVVVKVTTSYPDEVPPDSKSGKHFQHRRENAANRAHVHAFELAVSGPKG
ncbi:MAG: hypothetical protein GY851_14150 [bacterium]|nr:hypothetical protein [bacterium]